MQHSTGSYLVHAACNKALTSWKNLQGAAQYRQHVTRHSLHGWHFEESIGACSGPSVELLPGITMLSNHSKNDKRSAFTWSSDTSPVGWIISSHPSVKLLAVSKRFVSRRLQLRMSVIFMRFSVIILFKILNNQIMMMNMIMTTIRTTTTRT